MKSQINDFLVLIPANVYILCVDLFQILGYSISLLISQKLFVVAIVYILVTDYLCMRCYK